MNTNHSDIIRFQFLSEDGSWIHLRDEHGANFAVAFASDGIRLAIRDETGEQQFLYVPGPLSEEQKQFVIGAMTAVLSSKISFMRRNAAQALGYTEDARAITPLERALEDDWLETKLCAIASLLRMRDERAIEVLVPLLDDPNERVSNMAKRALETISKRLRQGKTIG